MLRLEPRPDPRHDWRRAFNRAGIEWPEGFRRCHDLRVTCATNGLIAGANPAKLQAKLGHRDFRVPQRYVDLAGVVFPMKPKRWRPACSE